MQAGSFTQCHCDVPELHMKHESHCDVHKLHMKKAMPLFEWQCGVPAVSARCGVCVSAMF